MGIDLAAEQRRLIADSFAAIAVDMAGATDAFYRHLFRIEPMTRELFVVDLERQGRKLAATLEAIVGQVDRWGLLRTSVGDLALRHLAYGVEAAHYAAAGEALLAMFHERLGDRFTPATEAAWRQLYAVLSDIMIGVAYPQDALPSPPSGTGTPW